MPAMMWTPTSDQIDRANLTRFIAYLHAQGVSSSTVPGYDALYQWSIAQPDDFWAALWRFTGVVADRAADGREWDRILIGKDRMAPPDRVLGPTWFSGARLNFAENLLRYRDHHPALMAWDERGAGRRLTFAELFDEVTRGAAALTAHGVREGDRVAAFMPNIPETVIMMLAAASIGAIWSSCSPDFGAAGVVDRFGQIEPRVLVCADGYRYAGKEIDLRPRIAEIARAVPSIEQVVVIPYLRDDPDLATIPRAVSLASFVARGGGGTTLAFARLPFDHPLYIMYSSGTTGLPKCMVHGAGGTLLQHLKEHVLHGDLTRRDRIFYFTTCGWMMWNWLVSALAVGATVVLYDGAPLPASRASILWDMAEAERITVFGTSAKYLALAEKSELRPRTTHDLSALSAILSTGSSLAPHSFDYVYRDVKRDVRLSSISGGTDLISCFALGNPIGPVYRGELQSRGLAMRVEVFDDDGQPIVERPGELVCTMPFPSMPVAFWNDPDGGLYRRAYFDRFANTWRHGDWAELTRHGGMIIHGRSDATLNPGGVRIGTAEIYRQIEEMPEIMEGVVVGQDMSEGKTGEERDERIVLFVRLADGVTLDDTLGDRIRARIRASLSPHHVPKIIIAVPDIPRTISGKISELAVRDAIHGRRVKNIDALANPESLVALEEAGRGLRGAGREG